MTSFRASDHQSCDPSSTTTPSNRGLSSSFFAPLPGAALPIAPSISYPTVSGILVAAASGIHGKSSSSSSSSSPPLSAEGGERQHFTLFWKEVHLTAASTLLFKKEDGGEGVEGEEGEERDDESEETDTGATDDDDYVKEGGGGGRRGRGEGGIYIAPFFKPIRSQAFYTPFSRSQSFASSAW